MRIRQLVAAATCTGADCVHDVVWQPATLPWWMRGFKSLWTLWYPYPTAGAYKPTDDFGVKPE